MSLRMSVDLDDLEVASLEWPGVEAWGGAEKWSHPGDDSFTVLGWGGQGGSDGSTGSYHRTRGGQLVFLIIRESQTGTWETTATKGQLMEPNWRSKKEGSGIWPRWHCLLWAGDKRNRGEGRWRTKEEILLLRVGQLWVKKWSVYHFGIITFNLYSPKRWAWISWGPEGQGGFVGEENSSLRVLK